MDLGSGSESSGEGHENSAYWRRACIDGKAIYEASLKKGVEMQTKLFLSQVRFDRVQAKLQQLEEEDSKLRTVYKSLRRVEALHELCFSFAAEKEDSVGSSSSASYPLYSSVGAKVVECIDISSDSDVEHVVERPHAMGEVAKPGKELTARIARPEEIVFGSDGVDECKAKYEELLQGYEISSQRELDLQCQLTKTESRIAEAKVRLGDVESSRLKVKDYYRRLGRVEILEEHSSPNVDVEKAKLVADYPIPPGNNL